MTRTNTPRGPFKTPQQASDAAGPLYEAKRDAGRDGTAEQMRTGMRAASRNYVLDTLTACGVELGAYDQRIAEWVAGWDPDTIEPILDWVRRARHAAAAPVLHWPARGLKTTTLCQGEPLTAADFAAAVAHVTCPRCLALEPVEPVEPKHALPPIDYPGRLAGIEPGPRCGAQSRTVLFAADVTCPACLAEMKRTEETTR